MAGVAVIDPLGVELERRLACVQGDVQRPPGGQGLHQSALVASGDGLVAREVTGLEYIRGLEGNVNECSMLEQEQQLRCFARSTLHLSRLVGLAVTIHSGVGVVVLHGRTTGRDDEVHGRLALASPAA